MGRLQANRFVSGVWRRRLLELLVVLALVAGVRIWQQRDVPPGGAPILQGRLLDGKPFAMPAKPASPVLVHFWATWCPVCRTEQSSIDDLARENRNVITVAMQSGSGEQVAKYLRDRSLRFPVVNDPDGRIAAIWGVHAVPADFIVDAEGRIRFVEFGYTSKIGLRLRLWLAGF